MNLAAALYSAGLWMISSAIWQVAVRNNRVDPGESALKRLGIDIAPAIVLALMIAYYF